VTRSCVYTIGESADARSYGAGPENGRAPCAKARGSPIESTGGHCSPQDSVAVICSSTEPRIGKAALILQGRAGSVASMEITASVGRAMPKPHGRRPSARGDMAAVGTTVGSKPEYACFNVQEMNTLWPS